LQVNINGKKKKTAWIEILTGIILTMKYILNILDSLNLFLGSGVDFRNKLSDFIYRQNKHKQPPFQLIIDLPDDNFFF